MPISLHSHSGQFCKHAYCSLEEVVVRAIEVGFTHYGLSEHMPRYEIGDLYEEEVEVSFAFELKLKYQDTRIEQSFLYISLHVREIMTCK